MAATLLQQSGDEVVIGELSGDPADWSDEVLDALIAEGVDPSAAGGPIGPTGGPGAIVSNEGCAVQCITSGVAFAVGTGAHLRVTTSTPTTMRITVFGAAGVVTSPGAAVQWGHTWPDLHHDTIYTALVRAEDANGNVSFASGDFHTLSRYARMEMTAISIQAVSPYEHPHLFWWIDGDQHTVAGGDIVAPLTLWEPLGTAPETVELEFQAALHDHQANCNAFDPCSGLYGVIVGESFELDAYPDDAVYWTSHQITVSFIPPCTPPSFCDEPLPLVYVADVVLSVWYE